MPTLETIQGVLSKVYCIDRRGRTPTPSAGNISKVELTLLSYPEGTIYRINANSIKRSAQLPEGMSENLIYRQIKGSGWLFLFSADIECYIRRYGTRSYRFVLLEAGHLCQALMEKFSHIGLATCPIGGFNDYLCEENILISINVQLPLYMLFAGFPE
jgi:nitroreductase